MTQGARIPRNSRNTAIGIVYDGNGQSDALFHIWRCCLGHLQMARQHLIQFSAISFVLSPLSVDQEEIPSPSHCRQEIIHRTMAARKSTSSMADHEAQETLPMYSSEEIPTHPLPPPSAGPREVREYIAHTLIASGQLESEQAHCIAAKWRLGTGQELRKYPATFYRDIFGHENAWVVYRHVRPQVVAEARVETVAKEREPMTLSDKSTVIPSIHHESVGKG